MPTDKIIAEDANTPIESRSTNTNLHKWNIQNNEEFGFNSIEENLWEKSVITQLPSGDAMSVMNTGANPMDSNAPSGEAQLTPKQG